MPAVFVSWSASAVVILFVFQNEMLNQNRALSKEILTLFGQGDLKLGRGKRGRDESFCCPCLLSLGKIYSSVMWDKLMPSAWLGVLWPPPAQSRFPPQCLLLLPLPALLVVADEGMRQLHN